MAYMPSGKLTSDGYQIAMDAADAIIAGQLPNYSDKTKFGINLSIGTATVPEDIWSSGGVYTGQPLHSAAAETIDVVSSDANDTSAGTGARTIVLIGLDSNWAIATEEVTMNGATPVTTTTSWRRCSRAYVKDVGSGEVNAGTITFSGTDTAAVYGTIAADYGQSNICADTIPANTEAYIKAIRVTMTRSAGSAGSAQCGLLIRQEGEAWRQIRSILITNSTSFTETFAGAIKLQEKTDFKIRCRSVSNNSTQITAELEYFLIATS